MQTDISLKYPTKTPPISAKIWFCSMKNHLFLKFEAHKFIKIERDYEISEFYFSNISSLQRVKVLLKVWAHTSHVNEMFK